MKKLQVGLYGANGHQIDPQLPGIEEAVLCAVCRLSEDKLDRLERQPAIYESFEDLLKHPGLELVSICSPDRSRQYEDIKSALEAGKHVYAEKPLVLEESELDELIRLAAANKLMLREMASTSYESPYREMREIVATGKIGEVVQVFAQKSYPYGDWRPQDEDIDGGLILQSGIHAVRLMEHVAQQSVTAVSAVQTLSGNPVPGGGLRMAASMQMRLSNGALGSAVVNYLNSAGSGVWGNDHLRIFGTQGFVESVDGGARVTVVSKDGREPLTASPKENVPSHFQRFIREILGTPVNLLPGDTEWQHPLRVVLRARESAHQGGTFLHV